MSVPEVPALCGLTAAAPERATLLGRDTPDTSEAGGDPVGPTGEELYWGVSTCDAGISSSTLRHKRPQSWRRGNATRARSSSPTPPRGRGRA